jgi:hypothetical protein
MSLKWDCTYTLQEPPAPVSGRIGESTGYPASTRMPWNASINCVPFISRSCFSSVGSVTSTVARELYAFIAWAVFIPNRPRRMAISLVFTLRVRGSLFGIFATHPPWPLPTIKSNQSQARKSSSESVSNLSRWSISSMI